MPGENFSWHSASLSDVGKVRELNEDSCLDLADQGLWAVADGMGGHSAGDLASQLIVNSLAKLKSDGRLSSFVDSVEHSILSVNNRLFELTSATNQTSGSTVVALLAVGGHCVFVWAGDSRLYRLRDKNLKQLTTDHSQLETYIEKGLLSREHGANHPSANMVTRAVGVVQNLCLDMDMAELAAGDRFLLCSDGLDKHVQPAEIEQIMRNGEPQRVAERLIELTLSRGATDNVTVIVVHIERPA